HASHIVGMPVEDGQALLGELMEFATKPQFVYRHKWHVGDLVIWDNRCTMHRATPYDATDHVRELRRTTIIDPIPEVLVGEGAGRQTTDDRGQRTDKTCAKMSPIAHHRGVRVPPPPVVCPLSSVVCHPSSCSSALPPQSRPRCHAPRWRRAIRRVPSP